jgi:hypothetical protein
VQQKWTVVASHELLEMLLNPYSNLASFVSSDETGNGGLCDDLEVCDPVYLDELSTQSRTALTPTANLRNRYTRFIRRIC